MIKKIRDKFDDNIGRVKNLVNIYDITLTPGHPKEDAADILRAAIVFLHATLEEFLRDISHWKLPSAREDTLNKIPFFGTTDRQRPDKISLGYLANYRNMKIDDFITASVEQHLERTTYNNATAIDALLASISIDREQIKTTYASLDALIARRHHIVHRADRNNSPKRGQHRVHPINSKSINEWIDAVVDFAAKVCNALEKIESQKS